MTDPTTTVLVLLGLAAVAAGFVDAVVGGGGLIQLPALLLGLPEKDHKDLRDLPFPMLADTKREMSQALGVLHKQDGVPLRATFIVDPQGIIRWASVNDLSVGRNVDEVLRTLDALQTDELCPCNWKPGDDVIKAA